MGSDRSQVRRDGLCGDRGEILHQPVDEPERLVDVVRWWLLHQVWCRPGGGYDEEEYPANRTFGWPIENALEQHIDRLVVEQAAIGHPMWAGDVGEVLHRRSGRHTTFLRGSFCEGHKGRLERGWK
jgi:hypothetical protein